MILPADNVKEFDDGRLLLGDSFDLLKSLERESVRLILTDPPYNVTKKNNLHTMGRRGIEFNWDGGFDQFGWLEDAYNCLVPGGSIVMFNDWKILGAIAFRLQDIGMDIKRPVIYYKTNPMPRNIRRVPVQRVEMGLWAVKSDKKCKWIFNKRDSKSYEDLVFKYPVQRGKVNITKKPVGMFKEIVEIFSNPGELVLDPFMGESTTAIACAYTGRRYICIDNLPEMFVASCAKVSNVKRKLVSNDYGGKIKKK